MRAGEPDRGGTPIRPGPDPGRRLLRVQDGPPSGEDIVEAGRVALAVDHPWLRYLPSDRAMSLVGEEPGTVTRDGDPPQLLPAHHGAGHFRHRAHHPIAQGDQGAAPFGDDAADEHRTPGDLGDMRFTFGLIGLQQAIGGLPAQHGRQLPAQVGDVAHAGAHALADPWRHGVGGVAGEEHPPDPPPVGDTDMVAVDHGTQGAQGRLDANGVEFANALRLAEHYLQGFAWTQANPGAK